MFSQVFQMFWAVNNYNNRKLNIFMFEAIKVPQPGHACSRWKYTLNIYVILIIY